MIRLLLEEDAEQYAALRRESLLDAPLAFTSSPADDFASDPRSVCEQIRRGPDQAVLFGAFRDGLVGATGMYRDRHAKAAHRAHIWGVYVSPAHRRNRLAAALLSAAIQHAESMTGIEWIHLAVSSSQPAARALYESLGFFSWGEEPDALRHEGRSVHEIHMALRLR